MFSDQSDCLGFSRTGVWIIEVMWHILSQVLNFQGSISRHLERHNHEENLHKYKIATIEYLFLHSLVLLVITYQVIWLYNISNISTTWMPLPLPRRVEVKLNTLQLSVTPKSPGLAGMTPPTLSSHRVPGRELIAKRGHVTLDVRSRYDNTQPRHLSVRVCRLLPALPRQQWNGFLSASY